MRNMIIKKALVFGILITPMIHSSLSAKMPPPSKHSGHAPKAGIYAGMHLPQGAISIQLGNFNFEYCNGVYYKHTKHGYVVTSAPRGAIIHTLPQGHTKVMVNNYVYYRANEIYYRQAPNGYIVVEAPIITAPSPWSISSSTIVNTHANSELSVWLGEQELLLRDGQFFKNTSAGLVWVEQPIGALTKTLPDNSTPIWHQEIEYNDVNGVLFRKTPNGYKVVKSPWL